MSNARQLAANLPREGGLSNRNLLINGDMQIHQRTGTITAGASNTYTLDRWIAREGVVSQSTDVPTGKGFKNSLFYDNGGVRSSLNFRQVIEDGFTSLDGQDVTISFWIKTSVTADIWVDLHDTHTSSTFNCPANTWVYHTYTASNVDTSAFTNYWGGPHAHLDFNFSGAYPDVYITGVQLEVGDTATPFEHRSFGDQLSRCQRYFQTHYTLGSGTVNSSNNLFVYVSLPVTMRVTPTISTKSGSYGNINAERSDTYDITNVHISHGADEDDTDLHGCSSFTSTIVTSGARTVGEGVTVMHDKGNDAFYFDAEL